MSKYAPLKLSPQMRTFCDAYLISGNGKQAALQAGYSPIAASWCRLLTNKKVINYLSQKKSMLDEKLEKGVKWKHDNLVAIVECVIPPNGEIDKQYMNTAINAMAEDNKMFGHYAPEKKIQINITEDEALKRLNELTNQILEEKRNARAIEHEQDKKLE